MTLKPTNVPLLDLKAQYATIRDELQSVISDVCDSQIFVMGPEVAALEQEIADYSQTDHGIGVSSGSDALLAALMALDIGEGDEVITSPFTFFATGGAIARLGATPVFCDIESISYNLDPDAVNTFIRQNCVMQEGKLINRRSGNTVRAIIPVHLFGQIADMPRLLDIAAENHLALIEDAAQAIGAEGPGGRRAGSYGDIGCFSFFPSKNLGAFGDGGMCVTRDESLADKLRVLRLHGSKPKYYHSVIGGNFRLDALQAAILRVKLKQLDNWTEARQANAATYDVMLEDLGSKVVLPTVLDNHRHIYNQYTIRVEDRDGLQQYLKEQQIGNEIYYPLPLHLQACFSYLGYQRGDCPQAEAAAAEVLSIPIYPELTQAQIQHVVACLKDHLATKPSVRIPEEAHA